MAVDLRHLLGDSSDRSKCLNATSTESGVRRQRVPDYYKNIPCINLLPAKRRATGALLGNGSHRSLRLGLVAVLLLAALVAQLSFRSYQQNLVDLEMAQSELTTVDLLLGEASDLRNQTQVLQRSREVAELDWQYLTNQPPEVMEAIASVITASVDGIRVTSVNSDGALGLNVLLWAETHTAAFEWRRQVTAMASVEGVAAFGTSGQSSPFQYQAAIRLANGGER